MNGRETKAKQPNQIVFLPMDNGAFGESEEFIAKWINGNVAVVIYWIFGECAGHALENRLAWIGNSFCAVACDHNSISC